MDLIAVHAGAGYQREDNKEAYFDVMRRACEAGMSSFASNRCPMDAVVAAVSVLEDSPLTNAGYGSNLSLKGTVECDASLMNGSSLLWAGVGSLPNIKNPIVIAKGLYDSQKEETVCGLVHPILLVGEEARNWAVDRGLSVEADLATERSLSHLKRYQERVEKAKNKRLKRDGSFNGFEKGDDTKKDTVGAIFVSSEGVTASAVSSGGVLLKTPGRLGQAASFGSGCWAEDNVAITSSGVGEYLIKTLLAMRVSSDLKEISQDKIVVEALEDSLRKHFMESRFLKDIPAKERVAGVLVAVKDPDSSVVELLCSHSSPSMVFGFQTSNMKTPELHLSRSSPDSSHVSLTTRAFMLSSKQ